MIYIEAKHVSKMLKGNIILNDVNFELEKGKIYGFKGRNGSGKTMLFRALLGLMKIDSGEILIDKKIIGINHPFPENTGIIIEYPGFIPDYTGFKNLKLLASIQNKITDKTISETMELVGLNPEDKRKVKKYSLGMKQRLGIAQAIMEDPKLLILDEPTNALDENGIRDITKILLDLKSTGTTILVASHDSETLNLIADRIFLVENGKVSLSSEM
ncbi:ATP-binding cassette domain-containing protein [Bacillus mycoides]|uniref:ATP-binding cassette domain-containing protein n=1 Tax=Bacillus mycoides TaxID=1405 RepID=UPI003D64F3DA